MLFSASTPVEHKSALELEIQDISQKLHDIESKARKIVIDGKEVFDFELLDGDPDYPAASYKGSGLTYPSYLRCELNKLLKQLEQEKSTKATTPDDNTLTAQQPGKNNSYTY